MGRIDIGRVILGGIVAGIVGNILGYIVDGVLLAPQWAAGMKALGRPEFSGSQIALFTILGLVNGLFMIWLYAAIRARFGAGPKTAIYAGIATWVAGALLPNVFMAANGLFPTSLIVMTTTAAIIEFVVAALAGAAVYKESADSVRSMAARA